LKRERSMVPDRFERYTVSDGPEGLHIMMRQDLHYVLPCGVFSSVMLAFVWVASRGPTPILDLGESSWGVWFFTGVWVVFVALVATCALWTEDWRISVREIKYQNSFRREERCVRRSPGRPIALRVEILPCDPDTGASPQYPHVARLIGPDGEEVGDGFAFRTRSNIDRFLGALRRVLPLEMDDHRPGKEGVDGPRKSPSSMSDRWLD
jgi:hypothetical protein